ncbi:PH domain-containing protein [Micromonospora sp. WMMD812]|uniref:PH domain-containing protein n=1 Tax=Micromonospora sp. WMMD812 TaxID=3015152 RepID=UPI00248CBD00|nr:PH domain-containing protein [Micromonospora sp. WMMD812]WBB70716.1 PH domain-containing protein [Micromonospora sp. WMMD812]
MTAVLRLLRMATRYEIRLWTSLYRWIFRRPEKLRPGDRTFGYTGAVMTLMWVFIIVSAIEIPILELIVPWELVSNIVLGLGIYGLFWMFGLLASLKVHPHVVGEGGIRIRNGISLDHTVPWSAIERVRVHRRSMPPEGQTQVESNASGVTLSLGMASQTSIDVLLREPIAVPVRKARGAAVTELRFHADDPEALVEAAQERLAAYRPAAH